jgi:hypothetical protein
VDSPHDDRLRKRQFDADEWIDMHELLKEWFYLTAPKQADEVMAEIAAEKRAEADTATKRKQDRARALLQGANPTDHELETSNNVVAQFLQPYPQYIRTPRNMQALLRKWFVSAHPLRNTRRW